MATIFDILSGKWVFNKIYDLTSFMLALLNLHEFLTYLLGYLKHSLPIQNTTFYMLH